MPIHDPKPEDGVAGVALTRFLERSTTRNRGKSSSTRGFLPRSSSGRSFAVISRGGRDRGVARKFESRGGGVPSAIKRFASVSPLPYGGEISSGRLVSRGIPILLAVEKKRANEKWADSSRAEEVLGKRREEERRGDRFWYYWKKMVEAKCDRLVETGSKLIYAVSVKKRSGKQAR